MTRRPLVVLLAAALASAACGSDPAPVRADQVQEEADQAPRPPLPFGLQQVDGTEPVGWPLVFDHVELVYDGEPVPARALRAAYRVTVDDPESVVRAWAEQLVELSLGDVRITPAESPTHGPWVEVGTYHEWDPAGPGPGHARVGLWATDDEPILLVTVSRHHGIDGEAGELVADPPVPPEPEPQAAGPAPAVGELLFSEQGDTVHVPEGARVLLPVIPTVGGTGGSTSLLVTDDETAVIQRMLDEAAAQSDFGEVRGPQVEDQDGTQVTTAGYSIPAGGWTFEVIALRTPEHPEALLWVQSWAD